MNNEKKGESLIDENNLMTGGNRRDNFVRAVVLSENNTREIDFNTDTLEATFGLKKNKQKKLDLLKTEERSKSDQEIRKLYKLLEDQENLKIIVEKAKVPDPLIPLISKKREDLHNITEKLFLSVKNVVVDNKLQYKSDLFGVVHSEISRKDIIDFYGEANPENAKKYANINWCPDYYVDSVAEVTHNNKHIYLNYQICAMRIITPEDLEKSHPGAINEINEKIYRFITSDINYFGGLNNLDRQGISHPRK